MDWSRQEKLLKSGIPPVMLIGAGATGFHVAHQLIGLGCTDLEIWDMDEIAESNLNRQLYGRARIGQNKAAALAEMLRVINPSDESRIVSVPRELEPFILTEDEVSRFGVFINATDNLYHHGAMMRKLALIRPDGDYIYISPRMAGFEMEVFSVIPKAEPNEFAYFHTKEEWLEIERTRVSCTDGAARFNPSIITTSVSLAASVVQQIVNWLNHEQPFKWVRMEIDTMKVSEREPFTNLPWAVKPPIPEIGATPPGVE